MQRSTVPGWYLQGFFNFPGFRKGPCPTQFAGVSSRLAPPQLTSMALLWQPSQPTVLWVATLQTSPPTPVSSPPPSITQPLLGLGDLFSCRCSRFIEAGGSAGVGGSAGDGSSAGVVWTSTHILTYWAFPISLWESPLFMPCWNKQPMNQKPRWLCRGHVVIVNLLWHFFQSFGTNFCFLLIISSCLRSGINMRRF